MCLYLIENKVLQVTKALDRSRTHPELTFLISSQVDDSWISIHFGSDFAESISFSIPKSQTGPAR